MRPIFMLDNISVQTDYGFIPWDAENDRVVDPDGEAGRLYQRALEDNGMDYPDPFPPPIQPALDYKPARTTAEILGVT